MKKIPLIFRIWKEGKYVDLWNIPHFLISILLAAVFILVGINFFYSILLIILIKTCWEIYEHKYVTKEAIPNKILDVFTGVLAVVFVFYNYLAITPQFFIEILIIFVILVLWGLYSMKKLNLFIKK